MTNDLRTHLFILGLAVAVAAATAFSGEDEFKVKREAVFEFSKKPAVSRKSDHDFEISFASKGWCDATVAIESADGRIVRHLASGVLGHSAPEPFQKDSLQQTLLWDGKDDQQKYLPDLKGVQARVSLGLKPQFEKTLYWSPKRRVAENARDAALVVARPEGVYVYDAGMGEQLRLFDHDGNYLRTIYPFPAEKLDQVNGLKKMDFPGQARPLPVKWGWDQITLLTCRFSATPTSWPATTGFGSFAGTHGGATALAIGSDRIALADLSLNRMGIDGSSGGMDINGPRTGLPARLRMTYAGPARDTSYGPRSAALSPDGKWVYLTGYLWHESLNFDGLHAVLRASMDGNGEPELFMGNTKQGEFGTDNSHLAYPSSVACDSQGRVYIADYNNDRIQVFAADKTLLKTIPVFKPAHLAIHQHSGELYVFSWQITNEQLKIQTAELEKKHEKPLSIPSTLTVLKSLDNPAVVRKSDIPLAKYTPAVSAYYANGTGLGYRVALDDFVDPPTLWTTGVGYEGNRILSLQGDKWVVKRDLSDGVGGEVAQSRPPEHGRQRLYFDSKNEKLYLGENEPSAGESKSIKDLICIDPETGKSSIQELPFSAEDLAFDLNGCIYLRTINEVARYDVTTWRDIPFDYGEEDCDIGFQVKSAHVRSCLQIHGVPGASSQLGGMFVSSRGHVVLTVKNPGAVKDVMPGEAEPKHAEVKKYEPRIYPGRMRRYEVHVFDKYGKPIYKDAVTGIAALEGIAMDQEDNVYVQVSGQGIGSDGKAHPNKLSCTLLKIDPHKARIVAAGGAVVPLQQQPSGPPDLLMQGGGNTWIEGLAWKYSGVGLAGKYVPPGDCQCQSNSRFALDTFARSFVSETQNYQIAVLDSSGNVVTRIGRYGNVDDGQPLNPKGGPPSTRSIGGDEVAILQVTNLAVQSDRRLFLADLGNYRILSIKLGYHAEERQPLE